MINLNLCLIILVIFFFNSIMLFFLGIYYLMFNLVYFIEFNIFFFNSCSITMTILLDWMSFLFLSVVLLISSFVIYYSKFYMEGDLNLNRFIMLIMMFVFSMILLVISPNLISILLGWDGLGLVSYCLVIYYQNVKSFNAGMLTVLSNRIGDVFLLMSISLMMSLGSWNYIFYLNKSFSIEMTYILIFILMASFTKSAQIPFSSWLPAAMAAPTPVSSLVHSSTLVTAGVYLLIRFHKLFNDNEILMKLFLLLSILTMFMSGLNANFENDLKKIIALSTLSQLGLMMSILFLGLSDLAFFHLLTHALFKALLFMCAGVFIHNLMNFQDIRYMGCLSFQMPYISLCFNIANLSLCGFPFLAGFYSKDLILELMFMMNYNFFIFVLFFLSTLMTVSYTFRLIYFSMIGGFNMLSLNFLNNNSFELNKSLIFLMMTVIFFGSLLSWLLFPIPKMICLSFYLKILPLMIIFLGMMIGKLNFKLNLSMKHLKLSFLNAYMSLMWFLPIISTYGIIKYPMNLSKNLSLTMDQNWTEYILGRGLIKILKTHSSWVDLLIFYLNFLLMYFLLLMLFWWCFYILI
uniref:NADH dehydrogenase subunit 5 n=1 Tax=Profenusa thomsoni TaxID=430669 RepID=UPI002E77BF37|nr:NADH dehydrogenase subunit 5 [Profenusa thomsoni]WPN89811.1 NADH dehydrogenase subunit 5 [Profenusa thomsoni]